MKTNQTDRPACETGLLPFPSSNYCPFDYGLLIIGAIIVLFIALLKLFPFSRNYCPSSLYKNCTVILIWTGSFEWFQYFLAKNQSCKLKKLESRLEGPWILFPYTSFKSEIFEAFTVANFGMFFHVMQTIHFIHVCAR